MIAQSQAVEAKPKPSEHEEARKEEPSEQHHSESEDSHDEAKAPEAPKVSAEAAEAAAEVESDSTASEPAKAASPEKEQKEQKLSWPGPPPKTDRMDPRMQETLQKLQALGGEEEKAKRLKAATAAAEEITMSLERKGADAAPPNTPAPPAPAPPEPSPPAEPEEAAPPEPEEEKEEEEEEKPDVKMAIVIHWSSVRGFGILRSQVHGEVAFQGASLVNVKEMAVGDMVTFDLGFDQKKNRPEAINIHKVGAAPGEVVGTSTSSNQKSSEEGKVKNLGPEKNWDSECAGIWQLLT
eukprot:s3338_g4.t1